MSKSKTKMGVCVVCPSSGRNVPIEWAMAIATLAYPVGMNHAWFISKASPGNTGMTRDLQREELAERALALGAKFMFTLDDDTVPPAHAIRSLLYVLEQNPKAAIAAGIYCDKADDKTSPLVWAEIGEGVFWNWTLGDVFKCKGIGTGCMMVRLSALKDIPKPWFKDTFGTAQHKETIGDIEVDLVDMQGTDDLYFCKKVTEAGWDIIAHGGVLPTHIGQDGTQYTLPDDCYPVTSYMAKREAALKLGQQPPTNLDKPKVVERK
jgi:hypothetical protein